MRLFNLGQFDNALTQLDPVIQADPKNMDALILRGNIYTTKKLWDQAQRDYEAALQIDDGNFTVRYNLAEIKFRKKEYDAARFDFDSLQKDADFGDLAAYKVFLCDLIAGHDDDAAKELAVFNKAGSNASYYFANAAWDLVHKKPEDARGWLASATNIYSPKKIFLYGSNLQDLGYLPLPPPPTTE